MPALVFGALLGGLATLSLCNSQTLPASLAPSLVTATTTIAVG